MKKTLSVLLVILILFLNGCKSNVKPAIDDVDGEGMGWAGIEVVESTRKEVLAMFPRLGYLYNTADFNETEGDSLLNYCKTKPQKGIYVSGKQYWIELYVVDLGSKNINTEEKLYHQIEELFDADIVNLNKYLLVPENRGQFMHYLSSLNEDVNRMLRETFGDGYKEGQGKFNGPFYQNVRILLNDNGIAALLRWFDNGIVIYQKGDLRGVDVDHIYEFVEETDYFRNRKNLPQWN